jgi:hypothetical protein
MTTTKVHLDEAGDTSRGGATITATRRRTVNEAGRFTTTASAFADEARVHFGRDGRLRHRAGGVHDDGERERERGQLDRDVGGVFRERGAAGFRARGARSPSRRRRAPGGGARS